MKLDDAIKHCQQVANVVSDCECADEHRQLAEWLQELKEFKQKQTNEEWFNSLQTSDKAKYIAKAMYFYDMGMPMGEALRASIRHEQGLDRTLEDDVIEWLKQPHKGD